MTNYTIEVINQSGVTQQFELFNDLPAQPQGVGAWSNVWKTAPGTVNGGTATFTIQSPQLYAVCGVLPQPLGQGVVVSESDTVEVSIAATQSPGTVVTVDSAPGGGIGFDAQTSTTEVAGCFEIITSTYSESENANAFCGLGRFNEQLNTVVPVATWQALPSQTYVVEPIPIYYVSTGHDTVSDTLVIAQLGQKVEIKFDSGMTSASVTLQDDGLYSKVKYTA